MPAENLSKEVIPQELEKELNFLIAHYLKGAQFNGVANNFIEQLESKQALPPRIDWSGSLHPRSYSELTQQYKHIPSNFLLQMINHLRYVLDSQCQNNLASMNTLLGNGQYSILQDPQHLGKKTISKSTNLEALPKDLFCKYNFSPQSSNAINNYAITRHNKNISTNIILNLHRCELGAQMGINHVIQPEFYRSINMHKRILGHLSAVYCICFDRTGRYILTGADDNLIKAWSACDGRLLATFRGHDKEISDIDVNFENTLMASGSCDKMIRIWNLRTTESISVLQGHTSMVTNVEFSPYCQENVRWLASSGNDGAICFWQWNSKTLAFNPKPKKFCERSRPGGQMLSLSFSVGGFYMAAGSNDNAIRVYYFDNDEPKKLHELELHVNLVDSIQYANTSSKFLSGSKDGTAVIWNYNEENFKWQPIRINGNTTLQRNEPDELSNLDIQKRFPVTMVAWNCDDSLVITAQSNFIIKIWNSGESSGATEVQLVHELKGHADEIYVLEAHPRDPRIILSASHDGHIIIWNILSGKMIKKFYNKIDNEGHGSYFDTKWSPSMDLFASTDSHGSLSIFGFGTDESYKKAPKEQFFHTDYRPLMGGPHSFVVDEQTQQPPHLMPPPFLVNADGNPYESDFQRLVPGRENLAHAQLIPNVVTHENGLSEIIGDRGASDEGGEPVVAVVDGEDEIRTNNNNNDRLLWLKDLIRPLGTEVLKASESNRNARFQQESQILEGLRNLERQKLTALQLQFKDNESPNKNDKRRRGINNKQQPIIRNIRLHPFDTDEDTSHSHANYQRIDENTLEDAIVNIDGDEDSNTQYSTSNQHNANSFSFTNAFANLNNNPTTTTRSTAAAAAAAHAAALQRQQRRFLDLPPEASETSDSSDYSDWAEEGGMKTLKPPPRKATRQKAKRSTRRVVKPVDDDEDEGEGHDSVEMDTTGTANDSSIIGSRHSKRVTKGARKQKKIVSDEEDSKVKKENDQEDDEEMEYSDESSDEEMEDSEYENEEYDKPCTSHQASSSKKSSRRRGRPKREDTSMSSKKLNRSANNSKIPKFILNSKECPKEYRPPEWLTSTKAKKTPYVPQIGDEVVYFRQGYDLYKDEVRKSGVYELDEKPSKQTQVQEFCKVIGMKIEIKPPRLVCLKLGIIDPKNSKLTGENFSIKYHDMPHVVDFVILRQFYERGLERNWRPKDRFKCLIDDLWYIGTITTKQPFQKEYPECEFQSLSIVWDSGGEDAMSPWDLEPISGVNSRKSKPVSAAVVTEHQEVTLDELKSLLYVPHEDEWPREHGRDEECERILKGLEVIMSLSIAEKFSIPVDLDSFPTYAQLISYPIDLNTIKERLEARYYRRLNAIQWDVRHIETNTAQFNETKSQIVKDASLLTELLMEFISDPHCTNPMPIYKRLGQVNKRSVGNVTMALLNNEAEHFGEDRNSSRKGAINSKTSTSNSKIQQQSQSSGLKFNLRSRGTNERRDAFQPTYSWQQNAKKLLDDIFKHPDSHPFREPVDTRAYPDYLKIITEPIDFGTIRKKLEASDYIELKRFDQDCRLVFRNSKAFNTDKYSKIYSMTYKLEAFYSSRYSEIHANNEEAMKDKPRYSRLRKSKNYDNDDETAYQNSKTNSKQTSKYFGHLDDIYDDQLNGSTYYSTRSSNKQNQSQRYSKNNESSSINNFHQDEQPKASTSRIKVKTENLEYQVNNNHDLNNGHDVSFSSGENYVDESNSRGKNGATEVNGEVVKGHGRVKRTNSETLLSYNDVVDSGTNSVATTSNRSIKPEHHDDSSQNSRKLNGSRSKNSVKKVLTRSQRKLSQDSAESDVDITNNHHDDDSNFSDHNKHIKDISTEEDISIRLRPKKGSNKILDLTESNYEDRNSSHLESGGEHENEEQENEETETDEISDDDSSDDESFGKTSKRSKKSNKKTKSKKGKPASNKISKSASSLSQSNLTTSSLAKSSSSKNGKSRHKNSIDNKENDEKFEPEIKKEKKRREEMSSTRSSKRARNTHCYREDSSNDSGSGVDLPLRGSTSIDS